MTTQTTSFGELHTKWTSHKHPENANFMQVVYWNVFEKNGKTTVCWHLGDAQNSHFIYGMTKDEVIEKYTDLELTENDYQLWLKKKQ